MSQNRFADYNGQLINADQPYLKGENRSFRYGDALFESIRVVNGTAQYLDAHLARLFEGAKVLRIEISSQFSIDFFKSRITELIQANQVTEGARLRLTLFREEGGFYKPEGNDAGYLIELQKLDQNYYELNNDGLSVDLYMDIKKPVNKLSIYKTANALTYIMAAIWSRENRLDDALIINDKGNIIEASGSNLFIVCNGVLYTPSLSDGCLAGVMRMQVINVALENKIKVYECSLTPQNLLVADEVFLTNASRGLQWVSGYRMKRYYNTVARSILEKINQKIKEVPQLNEL